MPYGILSLTKVYALKVTNLSTGYFKCLFFYSFDRILFPFFLYGPKTAKGWNDFISSSSSSSIGLFTIITAYNYHAELM